MGRPNRRHWAACAYCAQLVAKAEREHVFPRAWYPSTSTADRIFAPACSTCNREYGRVEERLFFPLVASLPTTEPNNELFERALAGMDPAQGSSVRDVSHRNARRTRLDRQLSVAMPGQEVNAAWTPMPRTLSEVTTLAGLHVVGTPTVRFRPDDLVSLATKFVRGCYGSYSMRPLAQGDFDETAADLADIIVHGSIDRADSFYRVGRRIPPREDGYASARTRSARNS